MAEATTSSRSRLLSLLTEACELEHALSCTYLFAAFSLKQDASEGDLTWNELQRARRWAGQIYFVASQEMLHMSQVWNLLTAIGGTPYYARPAFPQSPKYFDLNLPLRLIPFGKEALDLFVSFERPNDGADAEADCRGGEECGQYQSVGDLYLQIRAAFASADQSELYVGPEHLQIGEDLAHFPDLVKVRDLESALRAIDRITEQGEGIDKERDDCHFGMFIRMRAELETLGEGYARLVRPCAPDPISRQRSSSRDLGGNVLQDPFTRAVANLFDSLYGLMLRMLAFGFGSPLATPLVRSKVVGMAIELMPACVQPLGEALTLMPIREGERVTAGATFGMARHIPLPLQQDLALALINERLRELVFEANDLVRNQSAPRQLKSAALALEELVRKFVPAS